MKILTIDTNKAEVDLYLRMIEDGHKVKCYIKQDKISKNIGRGILDIVEDWKDYIDWADMIYMADNAQLVPQMDALRARGKKVFGPTVKSSKWELDRQVGQDIFEKCGIDTIPSESFNTYDEAIKYVKETGGRLVSKPNGDAAKELSYVSKSPEDMLYMLERWKKEYPSNGKLIIQKFIPGIEFAVGGWFGPAGFKEGWLEGFEFKKFMNDDVGVNTGEMGSVLQYVKKSKLAEEMLIPLEKELHKVGHVGYVDVAVIVDEFGVPHPLEFTMRPGYPTVNIWQEIHDGDCADWMLEMLEGELPDNVIYDDIAVGVCVVIPDFPFCNQDPKESVGVPIYGMERPLSRHFHPCECKSGEKTEFETAGSYVMVCTGKGETVKEASDKAYKALSDINIPRGMMYRTDIGRRLKKQLPKLHKFGYAMGFDYGE